MIFYRHIMLVSSLNDGICVTITGKPNVGKSTLLNQLSGLEKALVSNQPGTTRDLVEVMLDLDGIPIRFVDTAGIHQTDDKLENMGIDKAVKMINKSDLVLYVSDDINCKFQLIMTSLTLKLLIK